MKRPVFWAVVMFALGEVAGLFVRTWRQLGIAVAMLICVAGIIPVIGNKITQSLSKTSVWLLVLWLPVGCAFSAFRSGNYHCFDEKNAGWMGSYAADSLKVSEGTRTVEAEVLGTIRNVAAGDTVTNIILQIDYCVLAAAVKLPYIGPRLLVCIKETDMTLRVGDLMRVEGSLSIVAAAENPGQFDMRKYYLARDIRYKIQAEQIEVLERKLTAKQSIMDVRAYMKKCIYAYADEEIASLYSGMLLGDKTGISKDTKRLFECAGISHILSISALHISLVAMTLYKLLRRFGIHFAVACPLAGLLVLLYGTLTGWSFSAVRAAIMLGLVFLGELLGRKVDLLTSASIALLAMSISNPYLLLDSGVCIGFSAVVGIAIGQAYNRRFFAYYKKRQMGKLQGTYNQSRLEKLRQKIIQKFVGALIISTSIYITTAPVLARIYFSVGTYTILVNLIIVPLMTVVIIMGLLGLLLSCIHLPFGAMFFGIGGCVLRLFVGICKLVIRLPLTTIKTGKITIFEVLLYYGFVSLGILFSTKKFRVSCCKLYHKLTYRWVDRRMWQRTLLGIYAVYFVLASIIIVQVRNSYLYEEIVFLSVGQGDGILLRTKEGCNIVIDGGSTSNDLLGENILMPAIKSQAMHHVDYWIISHADKDHISGLETVLDLGRLSQIRIDCIVVAKAAVADANMQKIIKKVSGEKIKILYMEQGDKLVGENDFTITCVGPGNDLELQDPNERNSLSLCVTYESKQIYALFTGDAGADEMGQIAAYMKRQDENLTLKDIRNSNKKRILKVPHHGSKNSCIEGFYGSFELAVISCGRNNLYGHPHNEMLDLLELEGCEIMRTDELGAITIR